MQTVELNNPDMLRMWLVRDLMDRAFPDGTLVPQGGFMENPEAYVEMIEDPDVKVLLGAEDDALRAVAMLLLPGPDARVMPQVLHFYNEGSTKLRGLLLEALVEIFKDHGHMKVWAINQTSRPDSVWARTFRRMGEWHRVGSIMEVDLK